MDNAALGVLTEKLVQFGLTRQEATIYMCLLRSFVSPYNRYAAPSSTSAASALYTFEREIPVSFDTSYPDYCGQKNFVNVFKESLRNEIKLIELSKGEQ